MDQYRLNFNNVLIALGAALLLFSLNFSFIQAQGPVAEPNQPLRQPDAGRSLRLITPTLVLTAATPPRSTTDNPLPNQVEVGQAILVHDPATPDIALWFPAGAIDQPVEAITYRAGLPPGVNRLRNPIDSPFFFGAWILGAGLTLNQFERAVLISYPYDDSAIQTTPEEQLRMMLYVPALQGWTRLCGAVDVHANVASGLLTDAVPLESGANSLLALSLIDSPPIQQRVNELGVTTLAPAREDFRMDVLPETVPEGVYIEMTSLPRSLHNSTVQLISDPIDLKACAVDHTALPESSQLTQFPKPFRLEFRYNAATANRAGGAANLTVVTLQNGRWVNVENLGLRPSRSGNAVSIEVDFLGVFSLAVQ